MGAQSEARLKPIPGSPAAVPAWRGRHGIPAPVSREGVKVEKLGEQADPDRRAGRHFAAGGGGVLRHFTSLPGSDHLKQLRSPSSTMRRRPTMTGLSPSNCSRTPSYRRRASSRAARTRERRSWSGKKGQQVIVNGDDQAALSAGIEQTWATRNLRFSQMAPLSMYEEANTRTNLPAQIDIEAVPRGMPTSSFSLPRAAARPTSRSSTSRPGGCSILNGCSNFSTRRSAPSARRPVRPTIWLIVIGGLSAEQTLKTVKMASTKALDELPTTGSPDGRAFRDLELEAQVHQLTQKHGDRRPVRRQVFLP